MGQVIAFPEARANDSEEPCLDLLTAVDVAIRDLRDICRNWGEPAGLLQADECLKMLERAFEDALFPA
ncbi:MAG: hypothetical protein U1E56_01925 [Bauldia sp.]